MESLHLHYERPKTRVVAHFAKRTERSEKLLILLHDTGSNGERILTEIGRPLLREGFDVVAFDVTSNTTLMGIVNAAWQLQGVHAAGLWPRAVCDFAKKHQLRQQYKRLVVYGEGDGARYAGYLASLCEAFDTIILEGGDSDPSADYPSPLKRVHRLFLGYWHDHLTAFPARTSIRDILVNARSRLVLIGDAEDYRHRLRELIEPAYDWRPSLAAGATGTRLVFRPEAGGSANVCLVLSWPKTGMRSKVPRYIAGCHETKALVDHCYSDFRPIAFGLGVGAQVMLGTLQPPPQVDLAQRFYSASERQLWERFVDDPPPSFEERVELDFPELLRAALATGLWATR